ncbi:hypothetical protein BDP67DRAFT_489077 [Colletotrichum lupini]|nr:hypothetical protein BDP67DRAFT_489077 [Colletotrichum lupini]
MNIHRAVTELMCMEQILGLTAIKVLYYAYSVLFGGWLKMGSDLRSKRHRSTPACARCHRLKQKSLLQHLEHRLAELQRLKSASVDADDHGSVNEVPEADVAHDVAAQIASISITNNFSLSLFQGSTILPHKSKLFYPSERPPLKIPIRGIYHEVNPRTAGQAYASQFSSFNSQHVPLNVMERLFRNYTEEILPRFPCFSEAELAYHFNHTCINSAEPGLSRVQDALSRFVILMIMAISALNSKNQDFS